MHLKYKHAYYWFSNFLKEPRKFEKFEKTKTKNLHGKTNGCMVSVDVQAKVKGQVGL